jgi:NTE family protein
MERRALVLGGGGLVGIAWETGLLVGLADLGLDLRDADLIIGTSAGAAVGANLRSGRTLEDLYAAQVEGRSRELPARSGPAVMLPILWTALAGPEGYGALARLGRRARATATVKPPERRAVIERRLERTTWPDWPERGLWLTAVDADSGRLHVFGRDSTPDVVDAVAASCAVPGVWPPVRIGDRDYLDGGLRSGANADLATGCSVVVVLAPQPGGMRAAARTPYQLRSLGTDVTSVEVTPDRIARRSMLGNPLNPGLAGAAVRAGRDQAARVAERIRAAWTG